MTKSVLQTITDGATFLEKKGVENGRLNMEHLLAHVLECRRMQLYMWFDRPLSEAELIPLRDLTMRRARREPLQHLLGTVEFCGHEFKCDARALIPRPETEELVERALKWAKTRGANPKRVLDVGTGSGVIGLSLALAWPEAEVTMVDVSKEALALAAENAAKLGIEIGGRVKFVESNLFSALQGEQFDLIAANLPYIAADEVPTLSPEVQRDPISALDGGKIGTELMVAFARELPNHLSTEGWVIFELGPGQAAEICQALEAAGVPQAQSHVDYSGRERFVTAGSSAVVASADAG